MKTLLCLILCGCLGLAQTSNSSDARWQLALHFSPDFESFNGDDLSLSARLGRALTHHLTATAAVEYRTVEDIAPGEKDYRSRQIDLGLEYAWPGDRLRPYIGIELGAASLTYLEIDDESWTYGPRAGLQVFIRKWFAIDFGVGYKFGSKDVFVNDFVLEDTDLTARVGLRAYF